MTDVGIVESVTDIPPSLPSESKIKESRRIRKFHQLVFASKKMAEVVNDIKQFGPTNSTILISGETGTGKALVADAIYLESYHKSKPLVVLDCTSLKKQNIESDLFGHVRGAFTGADSHRKGFFEVADGGTIFLDEISETPFAMQGKLLRVLEEKKMRRMGSSIETDLNIRVIAATSKDLFQMVAEGTFRSDLYYRLNVLKINIPPLKDRVEDIEGLVSHFTELLSSKVPAPQVKISFSSRALAELAVHDWPGNVRELRNVIERAYANCRDHHVIDKIQFDSSHIATNARTTTGGCPVITSDAILPFNQAVERFKHEYISKALSAVRGNVSKAADLLGVSRNYLYHVARNSRVNIHSFKEPL